jgi:signal transduction histidine kinase
MHSAALTAARSCAEVSAGEAGLSRHEPADLAKVAGTCLASAGAEARRRDLHVETSLDRAPLLGDQDLIARLVANLLDNAVRHNVPGGTVEVRTTGRDGKAVLSVANSGPVIPPGEVGRLLQPFQRLATSRSSDGDGHGLGLPIVRAIATAHGATLTAPARPEGGLCFQVCFQAAGEIALPQPTCRALPGPRGGDGATNPGAKSGGMGPPTRFPEQASYAAS